MKRIGISRGKSYAYGETFNHIDSTTRANAHRLLEGSWLGTADTREVAKFIDDDSDEEQT